MRTTNLRALFGGWVLVAITVLLLAAPLRAAGGFEDFVGHYTPRFILPAVREAGDDLKAPEAAREFTCPYGASSYASPVPGTGPPR